MRRVCLALVLCLTIVTGLVGCVSTLPAEVEVVLMDFVSDSLCSADAECTLTSEFEKMRIGPQLADVFEEAWCIESSVQDGAHTAEYTIIVVKETGTYYVFDQSTSPCRNIGFE